jgi:hypothetical protein
MRAHGSESNFLFDSDAISTRTGGMPQVLVMDVMAEQVLDFESVPPVPSTTQFGGKYEGILRSGSSQLIPDYVDGMADCLPWQTKVMKSL